MTKQSVTKKMRNKGKQSRSVLTVNGSVKMVRRWWFGEGVGSVVPMEEVLDSQQSTVSIGVREMACRLNNDGTSFDSTADNLHRTALVKMSGEQLRQIVLAAGATVLQAQQDNAVPTAFCAVNASLIRHFPKNSRPLASTLDLTASWFRWSPMPKRSNGETPSG